MYKGTEWRVGVSLSDILVVRVTSGGNVETRRSYMETTHLFCFSKELSLFEARRSHAVGRLIA